MDKNKKEQVVAELREALTQAPSVVVASSFGMSANDVNEMRAKLRAQGVRYHVVKNTLAKRAISKAPNKEGMAELLTGAEWLMAFHAEDPAVVTAKVLVDFKKNVRGARAEGRIPRGQHSSTSPAYRAALSKMPSLKDELRAKPAVSLYGWCPTKMAPRASTAVPQNEFPQRPQTPARTRCRLESEALRSMIQITRAGPLSLGRFEGDRKWQILPREQVVDFLSNL